MTTYARIYEDQAFLFTEYGEKLARDIFGDAEIDALPKFTSRSKHAGKPKGLIRWRKVHSGGWVREMSMAGGHVENRVGKIISAELCTADFGKPPAPFRWWARDDARAA